MPIALQVIPIVYVQYMYMGGEMSNSINPKIAAE